MASRFVTDPDELRDRLNRLQEIAQDKKKSGAVNGGEIAEALAEGSFRLALDPTTSAAEAFELLHRAVRLDGTNPKFAYHLARLYFVYGQFEMAANWLKEAKKLAPTSHRIWAHISLLQKELNATYKGNTDYVADALLRRSETIIKAIVGGKDAIIRDGKPNEESEENQEVFDFVPPEALANIQARTRDGQNKPQPTDSASPAEKPKAQPLPKRLIQAGKCRWSGVNDLTAEWLLEQNPTSNSLNKLVPLLTTIAKSAPHRYGGVAAFAILGIEWVLSDYPIQIVIDLRNEYFANTNEPALDLFDLVCQLYEINEADLPFALADLLERGAIPPVLAALIHQRRLLWAPYRYRGLNSYHKAKKLLAEARQNGTLTDDEREELTKAANICAQKLSDSLTELFPKRPAPLVYSPKAAQPVIDGATLDQRLNELSAASETLTGLRDQLFNFMRTTLEPAAKTPADAEVYAQATADRALYTPLIETLKKAGGKGQQHLDDLMTAAAGLDSGSVPNDFEARKEQCKKTFIEIANAGNFQRVLARIDGNLKLAAEQYPTAAEKPPAETLNRLSDELKSFWAALSALGQENGGVDVAGELLRQAEEIRDGLDPIWTRLKELLNILKAGDLPDDLILEGAEIEAYVNEALDTCEKNVEQAQQIRREGQITPEQVERLDKAEQLFRDQLTRRGPFTKNLQKLPKPPTSAPAENGENGDSAEAAEAQPAKTLVGIELLEARFKETKTTIETMYQDALDSFAAYPEAIRQLTPFQSLRLTLMARQAEVYYRLGWRRKARQIWNTMLVEDRLDANLLKNIAVCDSRSNELAAPLLAWQNYAEILYLYDIVEGNPRPHAEERAHFHRAIADAYGPATLPGELKPEWVNNLDRNVFRAFFASPGQVRSFVNHKLLEFLNGKLNFRSPLLIVGVTRSEGVRVRGTTDEETQREAVLKVDSVQKLLKFTTEAAQILPKNVRQGFQKLCQQHIQDAALLCATPEKVSSRRDKYYSEEEEQQVKWVKEIVELKFKFQLVFNDETFLRALVEHMTSVEWIGELSRLDSIPVDLSPTWARAAGAKFGMANPDQIANLMTKLGEMVIGLLLQFIFEDTGGDDTHRQQQYQRLIKEWVHQPALKPYLEIIDDPQPFYVPQINAAFSATQKIAILRAWNQRYPELSGPSYYLAVLLIQEQKQYHEAIEVLNRLCENAFHQAKIPDILYVRMQAWFALAQDTISRAPNGDGKNPQLVSEAQNAMQHMRQDAQRVWQSPHANEEKHTEARQFATFISANFYTALELFDDAFGALRLLEDENLDKEERAKLHLTRAQIYYKRGAKYFSERRRDAVKPEVLKARDEAQITLDILDGQESEMAEEARKLRDELDDALGKM